MYSISSGWLTFCFALAGATVGRPLQHLRFQRSETREDGMTISGRLRSVLFSERGLIIPLTKSSFCILQIILLKSVHVKSDGASMN